MLLTIFEYIQFIFPACLISGLLLIFFTPAKGITEQFKNRFFIVNVIIFLLYILIFIYLTYYECNQRINNNEPMGECGILGFLLFLLIFKQQQNQLSKSLKRSI